MSETTNPEAPARLRAFIGRLDTLVDQRLPEGALLDQARDALADLVAQDDWLPAAYAEPDPVRYRQFLLYADPDGRYSIVSFVWGPGQETPVHDHTVWGLVGVLRGAEYSQRFVVGSRDELVAIGPKQRLETGEVETLSPQAGDIHRVTNAHLDRTSVSIHVYGADIGQVRRWVYPAEGPRKPFISGYSNAGATPAFAVSRTPALEHA
ncbi:cysteine dioxygenase [Nitrospirillum viridazoti]|uniref:Cysteine dioxygenase n=1 Tax=Nitrospirillum viridazoti CBAmc TaxID=1441467 RepID=A0A248JW17_9PROT|nr:cysteine dioxygenase [Nitrospirillum amazonense]ASG22922.1 cysteine dioxygenase [Nitrospirillum amazonense CBAmc]TWB31465.1 putative metal-dependent enzyme (double-stranded beta helix superfamily) [Nitrospirillum amazonense]